MTLFEYLMVLVSIIVGLAVAEILTGVARQIRYRESLSGYWVHSCGVALILLPFCKPGGSFGSFT